MGTELILNYIFMLHYNLPAETDEILMMIKNLLTRSGKIETITEVNENRSQVEVELKAELFCYINDT